MVYWWVPLDPDTGLNLHLSPLWGSQFPVLPFDLKGAPAAYQHLVNQLLGESGELPWHI